MFSKLINAIAKHTPQTKQMLDEIAEMRTIKEEINLARCIIELDAKGVITRVNENLLKALNYNEADLLNQHHKILVNRSESSSIEYQTFWQKLVEGITQSGSFQLQNKTAQTVWFSGYYAPVKSSTGDLGKVVCYLTDITSEKNQALNLESEDIALKNCIGVMECDLKGNILNCNEVFCQPLGYTIDELIGKNVTTIITRVDAQSAAYKGMWEQISKGVLQTKQIKRVAKNGAEYWFQSNYSPVTDAQGNPYKVMVYSSCITAEKRKNLDHEGKMLAIDKIQAIIEFDLTGHILSANQNFLNTLGYTESDLIGKHHSMFVDNEYKASNEYKAFWEKLGHGETDNGLYKRIGKNGKEVWLQANYNPILDLDGKPSKVVKYAIDVTQQKIKELDNEGKLASIDRSLGVIEFSMDGVITQVNQNFALVTGYSVQELTGKHHSMLVDPVYRNSQEYKNFWEKLNRGEFDSNAYHRVGKNGQDIWLQASYNPIIDMSGKPCKVVKFATDITEQHKTAAALEDAVAQSQAVIEAVKVGDLSTRVSMADKVGAIASLCDGINAIVDNMSEVILQVHEAGETINTAASEIATGNNDLSSRTEQQASSLEETASSMEELSSTVKQNAENAKQANQLATAASGVAVKGGAVVSQVVITMADINSSSRKIEDIISVIDGIAFQTNILALNAAVEAARAGEQGRGFAVVAGEVRNLAQRSAAAAKEIKQLISDSVSKVQVGTKLVEDAGKTMEEIVSSVQRVTDIMGEISAASSEQSSGISQVNNAITSMDEVTQQNAALVEEAAAAAESLVEQAVSLMDTVGRFKLNDTRSTHSNKPSRVVSKIGQSRPAPKPATRPVARTQPAMAKTGTDNESWEEF